MGRKPKYATEKERHDARKEQRMNSYHRHKTAIKQRQNAKYAAFKHKINSDPNVSRKAKDPIVPARHDIPPPKVLLAKALEQSSLLHEYTHGSSSAFALETARRSMYLSTEDALAHLTEVLAHLVTLREPATRAKNEMFTHHGRSYREWDDISMVDQEFARLEEHLDGIFQCLKDGTLREYMQEKVFPFCT